MSSSTLSASKILLLSGVRPLDPHSNVQYLALGAFTLVGCASTSLRCIATPRSTGAFCGGVAYDDKALIVDSLPPNDSLAHPDQALPSITRTAAESPAPSLDIAGHRGNPTLEDINPQSSDQLLQPRATLAALERASRLGTGSVVCAACSKEGTNFPRCKWCSRMWCSRECRVASAHRCGPRGSRLPAGPS